MQKNDKRYEDRKEDNRRSKIESREERRRTKRMENEERLWQGICEELICVKLITQVLCSFPLLLSVWTSNLIHPYMTHKIFTRKYYAMNFIFSPSPHTPFPGLKKDLEWRKGNSRIEE